MTKSGHCLIRWVGNSQFQEQYNQSRWILLAGGKRKPSRLTVITSQKPWISWAHAVFAVRRKSLKWVSLLREKAWNELPWSRPVAFMCRKETKESKSETKRHEIHWMSKSGTHMRWIASVEVRHALRVNYDGTYVRRNFQVHRQWSSVLRISPQILIPNLFRHFDVRIAVQLPRDTARWEELYLDDERKKEQVIRVKLAGTGIKPRYKGVKKGTDEFLTSVLVESKPVSPLARPVTLSGQKNSLVAWLEMLSAVKSYPWTRSSEKEHARRSLRSREARLKNHWQSTIHVLRQRTERTGYEGQVSENGYQNWVMKTQKGIDLRRGTSASGRRSEGLTINCYEMTISDDYAVLL